MVSQSNGSAIKAIFSLILTISFIFMLYTNLSIYNGGDHTVVRLVYILIPSLGVFFVPIVFYRKKKDQNPEFNKLEEKRKETQFQLKILKRIKLNTTYNKPLIIKCPRCKFENPISTKRCFNCLYEF